MSIRKLIIKTILSAILLVSFVIAGAQDANYYINKGIAEYNNKRYANAIANYTIAIIKDKNSAVAYYDRGLAYSMLNDHIHAIEDYNAAMSMYYAPLSIYNARGNAYYNSKSYDYAIDDYKNAIKLDAKNSYTYLGLANAYLSKGMMNEAIVEYNNAIRMNPSNFYAYEGKGSSYASLGQHDKAISNYTKVIALSPGYSAGYYCRGRAYADSGLYEAAIVDLNRVISIDPNYPDAFITRAYAFWNNSQYAEAIADYNKAMSAGTPTAESYNGRGLAYNDNGEYELAVADFKKAIELDEKFSYAYINIIPPLARLHRFSEAAAYYKTYQQKGLSTYIEDERWEFFKRYVDAISLGINNNNNEKALQILEEAEKNYSSIADDTKKAQKRSFTYLLALKGYVLEQLGKFTEAQQTYEQSLLINPNQPDVKSQISKLDVRRQALVQLDTRGPEIELISPRPTRSFDIVSDNDTTQIIGKAKDESGIASVMINNQIVDKTEDDGLFISDYILLPGANNITVTATDKNGNSTTRAFTINGVAAQKKPEPAVDPASLAPNYYAILIGEKDYQDPGFPDLNNPIKDAGELREILQNQYTFSAANIDTLYNRNREDIMQTIVQRCNTLGDNDNLIIFFAGHGTAIKDQFGDIDGYWIPVSAKRGLTASYISADDINKALKQSKARHILLMADACFSGAFTRDITNDASTAIQRQYKVPSRKIMASGNLEKVSDNSKFIYFLKQSLVENSEKYLSAKDLFDSFYKAVINNTDNLPQYAAIKNVGDEGGEFVFIKK